MREIAICGTATSSREMANQVDTRVELWGLNNGYRFLNRKPARWFDIHEPTSRPRLVQDGHNDEYLEFLRDLDCPIYLLEQRDDIPGSEAYPLENIEREFGRRYLTSSTAYMVALALYEGVGKIHIYGVNMAVGSEYAEQRACFEYWLGRAEGAGVDLVIPDNSPLLHGWLYGREQPSSLERTSIEDRLRQLRAQEEKIARERQIILGATEALGKQLTDGIKNKGDRKRIERDRTDLLAKMATGGEKFLVLSGAIQVCEGFLHGLSEFADGAPVMNGYDVSILNRYPVGELIEQPI